MLSDSNDRENIFSRFFQVIENEEKLPFSIFAIENLYDTQVEKVRIAGKLLKHFVGIIDDVVQTPVTTVLQSYAFQPFWKNLLDLIKCKGKKIQSLQKKIERVAGKKQSNVTVEKQDECGKWRSCKRKKKFYF